LRLDVRSAKTKTVNDCAVMQWVVIADPHAPEITDESIRRQLTSALSDSRLLAERIQERIAAYATLPKIPFPDPVVETFSDGATDATILEIRTHDRPALLFSIGDVLAACRVDIRAAIITTLGAEAIAAELEELPLPYRFDVHALVTITHTPLLEHIERVGQVIYRSGVQP
jgi:[protein-PII] uridylyltransferase